MAAVPDGDFPAPGPAPKVPKAPKPPPSVCPAKRKAVADLLANGQSMQQVMEALQVSNESNASFNRKSVRPAGPFGTQLGPAVPLAAQLCHVAVNGLGDVASVDRLSSAASASASASTARTAQSALNFSRPHHSSLNFATLLPLMDLVTLEVSIVFF